VRNPQPKGIYGIQSVPPDEEKATAEKYHHYVHCHLTTHTQILPKPETHDEEKDPHSQEQSDHVPWEQRCSAHKVRLIQVGSRYEFLVGESLLSHPGQPRRETARGEEGDRDEHEIGFTNQDLSGRNRNTGDWDKCDYGSELNTW
jgi:hypothetical protein